MDSQKIVSISAKILSTLVLLAGLSVLSSFVNEQKEYFHDDMPGTISFKAENDKYKADGLFERWKFTKAKMKERNNLETYTAELMIDMSSVKEKSPKLTSHLKAEDYFFVKIEGYYCCKF